MVKWECELEWNEVVQEANSFHTMIECGEQTINITVHRGATPEKWYLWCNELGLHNVPLDADPMNRQEAFKAASYVLVNRLANLYTAVMEWGLAVLHGNEVMFKQEENNY